MEEGNKLQWALAASIERKVSNAQVHSVANSRTQ
jgi:hypothetical protein